MSLELRIDSLAFGGESVGRDSTGRVVFVPGGAPGDLVEVRLVEEKRRFARGELVRVIEPGAERVAPPCALSDRCGGCPWMHVSPAAQLAAKQEIVRRALVRVPVEVRQIVAPSASLGYRVRARWTRRGDAVGYAARRSHEIVEVDACPALDPRLEAAMLAHKRRAKDSLAGLVAPDGRVQIAVDGQVDQSLDLGDGLEGDAIGFAQASWTGNDELRRLVREAAEQVTREAAGPLRVLELFAGSGNFTRDMAALAAHGVAVEGDRAAGARLERLLAPHSGWRTLTEPAARAVERLKGERFDLIVLDPPRAGAAEIIERLSELAPRMVYVSCDPMTLARDLSQIGWTGWAQPVDMMPHTSHVEVVACLSRTK